MSQWSITSGRLTPAQVAEALALADAAEATDGVAPLSEHALLHLRYDAGTARRSASPAPARAPTVTWS